MNKKKHPSEANPLFGGLPLELIDNLKTLNPWWSDQPALRLPPFRRFQFKRIYSMLGGGLAPVVSLRGPRRVGKTVILKQIIQALLNEGIESRRILYVPFDELPTFRGIREPVLAVSRWFESSIAGETFIAAANRGLPVYLFFDEVQNLDAWAPQIKNLADNHGVRALITGSSSLRIEAGRDSLAGRIATMEMGPLSLSEIAGIRWGVSREPLWGDNGTDRLTDREFWLTATSQAQQETELRKSAFKEFALRGGYPIAHENPNIPWSDLAGHLNETIIRRAIQHDLRMGPRGQKRDEALLEEVFRLCCRYAGQVAGQSAFVPEIQQALAGNIGWTRILSYLKFLDGTLLLRLIQPMELRLKKKKSPPKICISDHALRAAWLQEIIPLDSEGLESNPHLTDLAGRIAESSLGYFLASVPNVNLSHFPARGAEPEVDFVLTSGTKRIPIEVKYRRRIDPFDDTRGLRAFLEKNVYNAPFGLLVTLDDDVTVPDPRIIPISLSSLLWMR